MVLSKLPMSERPTNLDNSRARAYRTYSRCGLAVWRLAFLFSFSSIWDID